MQETWARLRATLSGKPSRRNWRRIIQAFEDAPASLHPQMIEYACQHLEHWPDPLRRPPPISLREWRALPKETALLQLATTLRFRHVYLNKDSLRALAKCPHLCFLRHLDLRHNSINNRALHILFTSPHLHNLRSIDLRNNHLTAKLFGHLLRIPRPPALETLDIRENFSRENVPSDAIKRLQDERGINVIL